MEDISPIIVEILYSGLSFALCIAILASQYFMVKEIGETTREITSIIAPLVDLSVQEKVNSRTGTEEVNRS